MCLSERSRGRGMQSVRGRKAQVEVKGRGQEREQ